MTPRPVRLDDLDALAALEAACFGAGAWNRDQLAGWLGAPGAVGVLLGGDAYAIGRVVVDEAELYRIGVRPGRRRGGLGRRVLAAFEAACAAAGAAVVHLEVRDDNAAAIGLYRAAGYEVVGGRPRYYRGGGAALLMRRGLPPRGRA